VVQGADGSVLASTARVTSGDALRIRVADGRVLATATGVEPEPGPAAVPKEEP
jgi:exodeoxyribonuclease VII large subunit